METDAVMKNVAIIANIKTFAEHIRKDIESYFCGQVHFRTYTAAEVEKIEKLDEEAIVLSSWRIFNKVKDKLSPGSILEVVSFTLSKENLRKMDVIKNVDRALLVNYDYRI